MEAGVADHVWSAAEIARLATNPNAAGRAVAEIPVLGYLDDLVVLPLGVLFIRRMIPEAVMTDCRLRAETTFSEGKPVSRVDAAMT
jgi:hypothetical protein